MMNIFKLGLIINPVAGIGGSVALKGSDGEETQQKALALGATKQANQRAEQALQTLSDITDKFEIITVSGEMGEICCQQLNLSHQVVYQAEQPTTEDSTIAAVKAIEAKGVDLILFAGGDGTARNIASVVSEHIPVLGIPAGCKIHSGVYAITPTAAGRVTRKMILGEMLSLAEADVMDIDESLFRQGIVRAKRYSEMLVPLDLRYVQAVKNSGKEQEELVIADICAHLIDELEDDTLYLVGSGSTTKAFMDELGLESTLLGVDALLNHELIAQDLTEQQIWQLLQDHPQVKLIITAIGGQGHVFGRGNQQLSGRVISHIGKENIQLIATKAKIHQLEGRPLLVDTPDINLNKRLSGPIQIITGYKDSIIYPIAFEE